MTYPEWERRQGMIAGALAVGLAVLAIPLLFLAGKKFVEWLDTRRQSAGQGEEA